MMLPAAAPVVGAQHAAAARRRAVAALAGSGTSTPIRPLGARPRIAAGITSRSAGASRRPRLVVEAGRRAAAAAVAPAAAPALLLRPELVFSAATYAMVPIYLVLAFLPRSRLAKAIIDSPLPVLVFGAAYAALAWQAWQGGGLAAVHAVVASAKPWPDASALAGLFQDRTLAAMAWLHLLLLDFLAARAVLLDGLRQLVPTWHSVLLCFMAGPVGLLSHLATRLAVTRLRGDKTTVSMWG